MLYPDKLVYMYQALVHVFNFLFFFVLATGESHGGIPRQAQDGEAQCAR